MNCQWKCQVSKSLGVWVCVVRVLAPFFFLIQSYTALLRVQEKKRKKWKCQVRTCTNTTKGEPVHVEENHCPYSWRALSTRRVVPMV
jgi:hypothetical protein